MPPQPERQAVSSSLTFTSQSPIYGRQLFIRLMTWPTITNGYGTNKLRSVNPTSPRYGRRSIGNIGLLIFFIFSRVASRPLFDTTGTASSTTPPITVVARTPRNHSARILLGLLKSSLAEPKSWNADYLHTLDGAQPSDVIYLDPPYQGTSGERDSRYVKGLGFEAFCDGLKMLSNRSLSLIISYDGRMGDKVYGKRLPAHLGLRWFEVKAGRSTQETLLGRNGVTYESLYISKASLDRMDGLPRLLTDTACPAEELLLF